MQPHVMPPELQLGTGVQTHDHAQYAQLSSIRVFMGTHFSLQSLTGPSACLICPGFASKRNLPYLPPALPLPPADQAPSGRR